MRSLIRVRRAAVAMVAAAGAGALAAGMVTAATGTTAAGAAATVAGVEAPLPANAGSDPGASLNSLSCASAGNCTAVGSYRDSSGNTQGLLLTQTSGTWAAAEAALPANADQTMGVTLSSVSCVSAGNCTAVGSYWDSHSIAGDLQPRGLLLTQTSGAWATGAEAALPANAGSGPDDPAGLSSVSCASAGNCTAVGSYYDTSDSSQGQLLTQTSGAWAAAEAALPANAGSGNHGEYTAALGSVSCASAGNCTATGTYYDSYGQLQGLLLTQTSGTWAAAEAALPANAGPVQSVGLGSVSCASAGNCTATGSYLDSSGSTRGLLLTQTAGTWATGVEPPLPANAGSNPGAGLDAVSCASAGNCTVTGSYTDSSGHRQGLLLTQTAGTWAAAEAALPANAGSNPGAGLGAVSCASAGNCTVTGSYPTARATARGCC